MQYHVSLRPHPPVPVCYLRLRDFLLPFHPFQYFSPSQFLPFMDRVKQGVPLIPEYWHHIQELPLLYKRQTQFCSLLITSCINQVLMYLFILFFCLCHILLPPSESIVNCWKYNIKCI